MIRGVASLLAVPAVLLTLFVPAAPAQPSESFAFQPGQPPLDRGPYRADRFDDGWGTYLEARLWVEDDREIFQRGDRMRVRFRSSHDAYIAVVHIDTDGRLDLVFPESDWDSELVRAGQTYTLPRGGWDSFWTVRERPGIGYFHLIASSQPLNVRALRRPSALDRSFVGLGGEVRGDPFWVLDRVTRLLVGSAQYGRVAVDTYGYQVGGRHRYPAYVCTDAYGVDYWDAGSYYGSCDRVVRLLRSEPQYYDTRRYRGDRSVYYRSAEPAVRHGFKEPPTRDRSVESMGVTNRPATPSRAPAAAPGGAVPLRPTPTRPQPRNEPQPPAGREPAARPAPRPEPQARPSEERPRLERRPAERQPAARPSPPREEERPPPRPAAERPAGERPAPTPRAERPGRPDPDS
jgi:hypothetical protein